MIPLKIKPLVKDLIMPSYAHEGDAGMDVFSHENYTLQPGERHVFDLGFATVLPAGYVALVWDRSSMAVKKGIRNLSGVIDSGYRGEWRLILLNLGNEPVEIKQGDKIAQILVQKVERAEITVVDSLDDSKRGEDWCGSSGG